MQQTTAASANMLRQYRIVGINLAVILFVLAAAAIVPRNGQALVIVAHGVIRDASSMSSGGPADLS
jgi:hypothetical protein